MSLVSPMRVRNWEKFQHYKNRNPPWIKLHRKLLDDFDFVTLPLASKALAPLLWLLASDNEHGEIESDIERLAFRLHWSPADVGAGLKPLIDRGFIEPMTKNASKPLAACLQSACPETETEKEKEKEVHPLVHVTKVKSKDDDKEYGFADFWDAYPKKKARQDALKAWKALRPRPELMAQILAALVVVKTSSDWLKDGGKFVPFAGSWIRGRRWEDEVCSRDAGFPARNRMNPDCSKIDYGTEIRGF